MKIVIESKGEARKVSSRGKWLWAANAFELCRGWRIKTGQLQARCGQ